MKRVFVTLLILPVRLYQLLISPLFPAKCIYYPSCSHYTVESLKVHGPIKGLFFSLLRILRCSPLFKGGVDPVTEDSTVKEQFHKYKLFTRWSRDEKN